MTANNKKYAILMTDRAIVNADIASKLQSARDQNHMQECSAIWII